MLFKQEKDNNGFLREVIFLQNNEQKNFEQIIDQSEYEGLFNAGGIFKKDNKFYMRYINYGIDPKNIIFKVNKLFTDHKVDPLEYHTVMVEVFPIVVKKKIFI